MTRIVLIILLLTLPATAFTQTAKSHKKAHHATRSHAKAAEQKDATPPNALPTWAEAQHYDAKAHVYFPDYYTFYDPARGGYLYWDNNNYTFSRNVPPAMAKADLSRSRIQVLKGLSLDLQPELHYPYYMKLYPAAPGDPLVPVPLISNPAH